MNFRWSNIYVLQFLVVLNVNGLKLVPADRTVIKQNGTTRTISRYYLLPHSDEPKGFRLGNTLTGDGGFSKFLREFERKNEKKKSQPANKKIVDRYRIYIKRKLKKNKNKDAKSGKGAKAQENKPEEATSSTSASIETVDNSTGPSKIRTHYITPPTPATSNESDDEYILKKKNFELTAMLPKLVMEQKSKGTSEPNGTLNELVWRTNDGDHASVDENVTDQNADQDPYKILMDAAAAQAQKNPEGKLNDTKDTSDENLKKPDTEFFADTTKTRSSEEKDFGNTTNLIESQNATSPEPEEPISGAELNKLYSQLYGKYTPETPIKPDENSYKHEPKSRQGQISVVVDDVQVNHDVPQRPEDDEAFKKLLSALHETPENFPDQAKKINPEQYNDMYKNPLEEKELKDKSVELSYDDIEDLHGFDLPSALLADSYDMTNLKEVADGPAKLKEKNQPLVLHDLPSEGSSSSTGVQNNNDDHTKNPLESYFQLFGIQNHDSLFEGTSDYVDNVSTSTDSSSTVEYDQSSSTKETTRIPPILGYNPESIKHTESVRVPPILGYQGTTEYSETMNNAPILGYDQANVGQSAPVAKLPRLGYNLGSIDDSKLEGNTPLLGNNQGNPEYAKPINKPPILGNNPANLEQSASVGVLPPLDHIHANIDHSNLGNPPFAAYNYENSESSEVINKYPILGYNQATLGQSVPVGNLPIADHNQGSVNNSDIDISPVLGYNQGSTEYSEPVRKPPSLGYKPASHGQSVPVSNLPGPGYNQESLDNLDLEGNPPVLGYNQGSAEYSATIRKPPILIKHSVLSGNSPIMGYSQDSIEYVTSEIPPVAAYNENGVEYLKPVANAPAPGFNQASTENADAMTNTYPLGYNEAENEYPQSIGNPLVDIQESTGYSETSRTPLIEENNPSPSGELPSEYTLPSDENVGSSSASSFMNHNLYNSTEEKKLRGGTANEFVYQEAAAEEEYISKKPNIEIDTNLVQIGSGVEVMNYAGQNNQPTFQDLANMCPECFKRIYAELMHKEQSGVNDDNNLSILQLFKDSSLFSYLQTQNQHEAQVNQGSSSSSSINSQGIIEFIQSLENQNHQVSSHSNQDKDQSLVKVLEIVLKGNEAETSANIKETSFPNTKLFTIENLQKVLEALERNRHVQTDKETANLYQIIKLIFETAKRQVATTGAEAVGASWFTRLNNFMGSPLKKYVYNLLRQTWLQEIMGHLYNNNYNLNIIRNPRWAAYLGAWRLPMQLINANNEYYDQNEYTVDYDGHGEFYQEAEAVNPQGDASVILGFLKQYLVSAQYYEQDGSVDYYRKQTEVFSRIAAFLRQRGYAVQIIEKLIRKLYAVLNANRALVTVSRPACMTRH